MALIIKGNMPKSCSSCRSVQRYRYSDECEYLRKPIARNGRLKDCPIIGEIPDKHGRIIDSSKAEEFCDDWVHGKFDYDPLPDEILSILRFSTPTILEAST